MLRSVVRALGVVEHRPYTMHTPLVRFEPAGVRQRTSLRRPVAAASAAHQGEIIEPASPSMHAPGDLQSRRPETALPAANHCRPIDAAAAASRPPWLWRRPPNSPLCSYLQHCDRSTTPSWRSPSNARLSS